MRTTVILNEKIAVEAKRLAAERNTTLSEIVNEALRERLAHPPENNATHSFHMPVYRGGDPAIDTPSSELAGVGETGELDAYRS